MKNIYFTPGPSQLYHTFEEHFRATLRADVGSISHRSQAAIALLENTSTKLRTLLSIPEDYHIYFLNSANEAWDRIHQNLIFKKSHHFVNGSFSKKFYDFALMYQLESSVTEVPAGQAFVDIKVPDDAELISITKNETSVGYTFLEEEIQAIRNANPDKLIALDIVSASPTQKVDFSQIDTAYLSVQKCFGMPSGLGIWIVNDRCITKAREVSKSRSIGSYRTLPNLQKFGTKFQTPETPNLLFINVLGKICQDLLDFGLGRIRNEAKYKAVILDEAIKLNKNLEYFVSSQPHRSLTTAVIETPIASTFIEHLKSKGLVIGSGYGTYKNKHIRIANFPAHSKEVFEALVDELVKYT